MVVVTVLLRVDPEVGGQGGEVEALLVQVGQVGQVRHPVEVVVLEALEVLEVLEEKKIAVTSQPWNRRYREYTEMLNSGSLYEVAKVLRDLSLIKTDKDLSFGERGLLDKAKSLLVTELAVSRRCKEQRVQTEIEEMLGL